MGTLFFRSTELENKLGPEYSIFTWDEQNKSLVNAMKMERLGTMVVLCLIFLVAAFNLAANLTLISIQKMKEVGVIRAMGAPIKSIYRIIILLGLKRAGIGLLFGFLIGILLILIQTLCRFNSSKLKHIFVSKSILIKSTNYRLNVPTISKNPIKTCF